jgi:hypothetical protein
VAWFKVSSNPNTTKNNNNFEDFKGK